MKDYIPEGSLPPSSNSTYTLPYLERAMERGSILEAPVILCDNEMNLHVSLGSYIGIIPREEAVYTMGKLPVKDIAILTRVGKTVCFCVTSIDKNDGNAPNITLSRRAAQKACYKEYISTLRSGDVIPAKVTHMESFGAFLDVGCGITALLPIDGISVSRISHPRYRFSVGDAFPVVIRSMDEGGRIYTSRKELLGTWEENASLFAAGQTVAGIVRSIESYGIFVELTPNLTGLAEYKEGVKENEIASVYIKSICPERMKVKLIIIDSHRPLTELPKTEYRPEKTPKHIAIWRYSPDNAIKCVESVFSEE